LFYQKKKHLESWQKLVIFGSFCPLYSTTYLRKIRLFGVFLFGYLAIFYLVIWLKLVWSFGISSIAFHPKIHPPKHPNYEMKANHNFSSIIKLLS
jgi:hypothetical protein